RKRKRQREEARERDGEKERVSKRERESLSQSSEGRRRGPAGPFLTLIDCPGWVLHIFPPKSQRALRHPGHGCAHCGHLQAYTSLTTMTLLCELSNGTCGMDLQQPVLSNCVFPAWPQRAHVCRNYRT